MKTWVGRMHEVVRGCWVPLVRRRSNDGNGRGIVRARAVAAQLEVVQSRLATRDVRPTPCRLRRESRATVEK